MEFIDYYYQKDSTQAIATPTPNNGKFKIFSIAYPMLAKSVSKSGIESPTGNSTNALLVTKGADPPVSITLAEGFPNLSQLQTYINDALKVGFPSDTTFTFNLVGNSQAKWSNTDVVAWTVNYVNSETKALITGDGSGALTLAVPAGTSSAVFNPDPTLGLSSLEFRIANGERLAIPSAGSWLDNIIFYFPEAPDIVFQNSNNSRIVANYASLRVTKDLASTKVALIRVCYE